MKKSILFFGVCMAIILFSDCSSKSKKDDSVNERLNDSITIIKIPDANFKTYLLENFDDNKDGNISLLEAKAVKEINCSGKNIKSLAGIENFKNLESLDCSNNEMDDVELQYNRKLNKLVCTGNNVPFMLYIGMSSPLRNPKLQKPAPGEPPKDVTSATQMLDESKCTYDHDKTNIYLTFND